MPSLTRACAFPVPHLTSEDALTSGRLSAIMGRPFKQWLNADRIYSCSQCRAHIADHTDMISKAFQGRHGRAYLFSTVVNVVLGPKEDRLLITGLHTVADISCSTCGNVIGWKYLRAQETSQAYKEGKFICEKARVLKEGNW